VKVIAAIFAGSVPFAIIIATRAAISDVLPVPAAASTKMLD
jgi:hypothetical protein